MTPESTMPRIKSTRHVLAVKNLSKSADYFLNSIGFSRDFAVEGWEFLSFGDFRVMLGECPDEVPAADTNNHSYFAHVLLEDGVDQLFKKMKSNGVTFNQEVQDKAWGLREFGVVTPDGHRIVFGQAIE